MTLPLPPDRGSRGCRRCAIASRDGEHSTLRAPQRPSRLEAAASRSRTTCRRSRRRRLRTRLSRVRSHVACARDPRIRGSRECLPRPLPCAPALRSQVLEPVRPALAFGHLRLLSMEYADATEGVEWGSTAPVAPIAFRLSLLSLLCQEVDGWGAVPGGAPRCLRLPQADVAALAGSSRNGGGPSSVIVSDRSATSRSRAQSGGLEASVVASNGSPASR